LGYDSGDSARVGDRIPLTIYWQATAPVDRSYTVFVHLVGADGQIWGQQDSPPGQGRLPTTGWVVGEVITDQYQVPVKAEAPPGEYRLLVGMYDASTGRRLEVNDATAGDNRVLLGKVIVEAKP
jgi:hypothetical protein